MLSVKKAAEAILTARKPIKSNTFLVQCLVGMKLGEHEMKIKTYRTNNKMCLKWYLKLRLIKTARAHEKSLQKNFSSISLKTEFNNTA